jgi:hypothetical protein
MTFYDFHSQCFRLPQHGTLSLLCIVFLPNRGEKTTHKGVSLAGKRKSYQQDADACPHKKPATILDRGGRLADGELG